VASLAKKVDFPTAQIRRYLEPGPIVLLSSALDGRANIMTMGWHTVMEFTPSLIGCVISSANHSFEMVRRSRECVINLPTTKLTDVAVGIGNTTGAEIDKFQRFRLTATKATKVEAPLIGQRSPRPTAVSRDRPSRLIDKINSGFSWRDGLAHSRSDTGHPWRWIPVSTIAS
jgi:hypothetical protein